MRGPIHAELMKCRWTYEVGSAGIAPVTCQEEVLIHWPPLADGRELDRGGLCPGHREARDMEISRRGW